ncbi:MAG: adenylate/guanylate cyclase domain-containing protein [Hydrogenophaga sp.]|uniref:adenylate/guanylate cyclase domain-containing protein n=1 Tax=Hydrogenophaga sp. TaxID=1904254 RepID=UPI0027158C91|nr:adenylate/guanylate cyclase domain-containing protein [Hydrogenophaga sp.]MDO9482497.1 adenylate/guanylate cyclase domain-containing protein [Hydrogenophaga sp.]MDP2222309.1 adenylate/guanylate cyclase domain-containing protein [Hydrogenophaga sp.]MDP3345239.1 adenylate/guanylate cyclase domain-containing protein [Hydrogenophaga sp.]
MAELTVAFIDLTGSVSVFETLGDDRAAKAIMKLTHWIGSVGLENGGDVVKMLGDGVLLSFSSNLQAVETIIRIQQEHSQRTAHWPHHAKLLMQIGMARGQVLQFDGDCFGDSVNVASRLSDLAGPEQILVTGQVVRDLGVRHGVRSRLLGPMQIKGRVEPCDVFRIEWQPEMLSEFLTLPSDLFQLDMTSESTFVGLELKHLGASCAFKLTDFPLRIGRVPEADFVVNDPRVSRLHARIDSCSGNYVLKDTSSYGTWVRFEGHENTVALRRQECLLHSRGEIAMGAPFSDFNTPTVSFRLVDDRLAFGDRTVQV